MPKLTRDFRFQSRPMPELEPLDWCYGLGEKDTDYRLTEWVIDSLPTLYQQDDIIFEYNQGKQSRSKKSCTLFSPIWAVSDLFNVEIPLDTIKKRDASSYDEWRQPNCWWYVARWVDHIRDCWNNSEYWKKYWKVASYRIDLKDNQLLHKVLDKHYTVCTWYDGNADYNNDTKDWVLDKTEFWKKTYGHAISTIWSVNKNPQRIKDNYAGTKYNIYDVAHEFSEIPCFFTSGYVFTKVAEDNLEEIKRLNEFKSALITAIEQNSRLWHLTNDKNYQSILHYTNEKHRAKVKDIDSELKKYL